MKEVAPLNILAILVPLDTSQDDKLVPSNDVAPANIYEKVVTLDVSQAFRLPLNDDA